MDQSAALSPPSVGRRFQIDAWTVEPARNELCDRRGQVVRLEPKVMEVLTYLAARPGEVVPREELLQALWPGLVVGEESLTQTILKLRKALSDSARDPRYIETIPKRGYRLMAVPRFGDPASAGGKGPAYWGPWFAVALLILCAAGLVGPSQPLQPEVSDALSVTALKSIEGGPLHRAIASRLTTELRHSLAKTSKLRLAGETMSGSHYTLTGEVRPVGERTRVYVSLAEGGIVLWSERFERASSELATQPEELARNIAAALAARMRDHEMLRAAKPYTRDVDAFKLFESGREASAWRGETDGAAARELLGKAIARDPTFARAYAASAVSYARDYRYGFAHDGAAALERAHALATTAIQIDPRLPEARFALAFAQLHRREHAAAEKALEQALQLDPRYGDAYGLKAHVYLDQGKTLEAIPLVRTAMRLSGQETQIHFLLLGRAYYAAGDTSQALINLREACARNPADLEARLYLAVTLASDGQSSQARWEAEEIQMLHPGFRSEAWLQRYPLADATLRNRLAADLAQLGL